MRSTDIRVVDCKFETESFAYRSPIKFGGVALDKATLLNTEVTVETSTGKRATGRGSMPMGNVWAFPTKSLTYEQTLNSMLEVAKGVAGIYTQSKILGHPIEITWQLEHAMLEEGGRVSKSMELEDPVPSLAVLVAASPFDAALHDAFGKLHGLNSYHTYADPFLDDDIGRFLGDTFKGVRIRDHVLTEPVAQMPLYHLVGALDPLTTAEVTKPVGDGLPETLGEWILFNGLTHLKIKLNGDDLEWDVNRVLGVENATKEAQAKRGITDWKYSLDFNEKCRNVRYLLDFIEELRGRSPSAFSRISYIEQPTARDLSANRANVMHDASRQIPVVIDESLVDLDSLFLAREMGYTGVALKACKGQSQSVLFASAARHLGMFLCVQDLTCPGASLIQSASLAAHVKGVQAIESNGRQYCPAANKAWEADFPGLFLIKGGMAITNNLNGLGLGAYKG